MANPLPTSVALDAAEPSDGWGGAAGAVLGLQPGAGGLGGRGVAAERVAQRPRRPLLPGAASRVGIAVILAVSLNLINGITGKFSLGHAGFMGVGAYTCGVLIKHWVEVHAVGSVRPPPPVYLFIAVTLLGGLVAAVAGWRSASPPCVSAATTWPSPPSGSGRSSPT